MREIKKEYQEILEAVKSHYGLKEEELMLPDDNGRITFCLTMAFNLGRFGYKAKDTFDITGYSNYTDYKNKKKHIYLNKPKEQVIKKVIEKIEQLKQELLEIKKQKTALKNRELSELENVKLKYGCLEAQKLGLFGYKLKYKEYNLIQQFDKCIKVEFNVEKTIEQVRTLLRIGE